ncbi:MAG: AI-2E family transporter, partial [Gammaproteobacteria bacterium]|nr:AI-2E family transporter [Gammaproteobacteria bacterium]MYE51198.1 AI-2E family transporter [Gammaproteobacteria bacterium]
MEVISGWVNRYFSNEEAIYLVALLVVGFLVLFTLGGVLAPVLTGLVLAFLLQGLVKQLVDWRVPEAGAVWLAFLLFIGVLTALALFVAPLVWQQLRALVEALPGLVGRGREAAGDLALAFPELLTEAQITQWLEAATNQVGSIGASALEALVANLSSMVGILIYLVLVPISVFFFLKDRRRIMGWLLSAMPRKRSLIRRVGEEMNQQLANYVRGKFIEILIVGFVTFVTFTLLGLNYAALLGVLVGVSVLIPFVGAAVVTIPVALVGIIQFGWSWELAYVMAAYGIIQALDGNVLVPLLFSEAVDLHPITIIVAVLAFGGLWGVWGVFFAIPLATLIKAIINAWPREMGVGAEDFASKSRSE